MLNIPKTHSVHPLKKRKRLKKVFIGSSIGLVVFLMLSFSILTLAPGAAANFADYVLRPTIGSTATVSIESFFFSVSDWVKHIFFSFGAKQSNDIFNSTNTPKPIDKNTPVSTEPIKYMLDKTTIKYHPGTYCFSWRRRLDTSATSSIWHK